MTISLYSKTAEKKLIGLLINKPPLVLKAIDILDSSEFYFSEYALIYLSICKVYKEYNDIEISRLISSLEEYDKKTNDEWYKILVDIQITRGIEKEFKTLINHIKEKAKKRELLNVLEKQADTVNRKETPLDDLVRSIEGEIFKVTRNKEANEFISIKEVTTEYTNEIKNPKLESDVKPGFSSLEEIIPSFNPGEFIILAARPSMGKTAFSLSLALNFAVKNNVAFFSIEMPRKQIIERILANKTMTDSKIIANPNIWNQHTRENVEMAIEKINELKLYVDDSPEAKLGEITWKARIMKEQNKLDVIIIDYLGLITHEINGRRVEPKTTEVSEISRQLKSLSRELDIPIIALSQLNRSVESRENKRPMMSDLRDSGSLEQDADIIMFLYREQYYQNKNLDNPIKTDQEDLEIIVSKNRNGATGKAVLKFMMNTGHIFSPKTMKGNK